MQRINQCKKNIIHDDEFKTLVFVNLDETMNWTLVKGSSNWIGVTFVDGNYLTERSNFAFAFKSKKKRFD